ncbi:MAG: phosphoheptose isomerase [Flavobacterium sp.]|jgi:mannose-6-phosphate isomerase
MNIFEIIKQQIKENGLTVASFDFDRPWGGFFVIDEEQAQLFANVYFEGLNVEELRVAGKLSPKILLVKPSARLSWQYHHRRAETWRIIQGPVGIITSQDDTESSIVRYEEGTTLVLHKGERHRLIGLNEWSVVAEFWQHTDALNPSDEEDIVRVQDDYSRK